MIILILYENDSYKNECNDLSNFNKLKFTGDRIVEKVYSFGMENIKHDFSIGIFQNIDYKTNFMIQIENAEFSQKNSNDLCHEEKDELDKNINNTNLISETNNVDIKSFNLGYCEKNIYTNLNGFSLTNNININETIIQKNEVNDFNKKSGVSGLSVISKKSIKMSELKETLKETIYELYNFQKVTLHGITVRDSLGLKIKPKIKIFVCQKPNFELYNITLEYLKKVNENLFIRERYNDTYDYKNIKRDNMLLCHTENEILLNLLESTSLHFKNAETGSIYKFKLIEGEIYIESYRSNNDPYYSTSFYIDDSVKKEAAERIIQKTEMTNSTALIDAFTNNAPSPEIDNNFKLFVDDLKNNIRTVKWNSIFYLLTHMPIFEDHRKKYYKKLVELYELKPKRLIENEIIDKRVKCKYLTLRKPVELDPCPVGTLKNEIYNNDKD